MKETKPVSNWYHNTANSMEPYFVCLHYPNLVTLHEPIHILVRGFTSNGVNLSEMRYMKYLVEYHTLLFCAISHIIVA